MAVAANVWRQLAGPASADDEPTRARAWLSNDTKVAAVADSLNNELHIIAVASFPLPQAPIELRSAREAAISCVQGTSSLWFPF